MTATILTPPPPPPPPMEVTLENIEEVLKDDAAIEIMVVTIDGQIRCRNVSKTKFLAGIEKGIPFNSAVFIIDPVGGFYGPEFFKDFRCKVDLIQGAGDFLFKPDLSTFRRKPWADDHPVVFGRVYEEDMTPLLLDTRNVMSGVMDKFKTAGLTPYVGTEVEFVTYKETTATMKEKMSKPGGALTPLRIGSAPYSFGEHSSPFYQDIIENAVKFRVPVEAVGTEGGLSVEETSLEFSRADEQADRVILYKHMLRGVGEKHGILPVFMAVTHEGLQGSHFHISLVDDEGKNVFYSEKALEGPEELEHFSEVGRHFLAGIIEKATEVSCLISPTINSYRRSGIMRPFGNLTWGFEHRGSALRVIYGDEPKNTRVEVRLAPADTNPQLSLAAILSIGLRGVEKKLPLTTPPVSSYYNYEDKYPKSLAELATHLPDTVEHMPDTLEAAVVKFRAEGSVSHELFDDNFVEHFARTRDHETGTFNKEVAAQVSGWEFIRYGVSF